MVGKIADDVDIGTIFGDPIFSGDSAVKKAVIDIASDFLSANDADLNLRIIDGRTIRARGTMDVVSRFFKKIEWPSASNGIFLPGCRVIGRAISMSLGTIARLRICVSIHMALLL